MTREEKLETLIAYAESFPPLPERFKDQRDKMEAVPECMTPVFLISEKSQMADHLLRGYSSAITHRARACVHPAQWSQRLHTRRGHQRSSRFLSTHAPSRGDFRSTPKWVYWCTCTYETYCSHNALDNRKNSLLQKTKHHVKYSQFCPACPPQAGQNYLNFRADFRYNQTMKNKILYVLVPWILATLACSFSSGGSTRFALLSACRDINKRIFH